MTRARILPHPLGWLVAVATLVNFAAGGLTFIIPDILNGPAVMNGSARGTGLVMAVVATPVLLAATWYAVHGQWRGLVVMLGALAYLLYNDVLLLFATPFNRLFLVYVAAFSLAIFATLAVLVTVDPRAVSERLPRVPARGIAIYAWVVVVLNALAWLGPVVPGLVATYPPAFLQGTGMTTNPIYVQDLSFWLPGAAILGWMLWRRLPFGILLGGAWLVYGLVEAVGVATDQWFGSTADPTSAVATTGGVVLFVVIGLIAIVPLVLYFRGGDPQEAPLAAAAQRA
jgi:hypothetical protein